MGKFIRARAGELLCSLAALVCIGGYAAVVNWFSDRPLFWGGIFGLVFILSSGGIIAVRALSRRQQTGDDTLSPMISEFALRSVQRSPSPAVIIDRITGVVLWCNKAAVSAVTSAVPEAGEPVKPPLPGKNISLLFGVTVDRFLQSEKNAEKAGSGAKNNADIKDAALVNTASGELRVELKTADGTRAFAARSYPMQTAERPYLMIILDEITERERLLRRLADEGTVVMYIVIDNLDELLQYEQEKYRSAATQVEDRLRRWAEASGGLLKEYERDKYLFFCSCAALDGFIADRFAILEQIRSIRVGDGNLPVTISIGASRADGSLVSRERAAYAALDLALQRGGDQVVLRTPERGSSERYDEFYGGRTKTGQKRTRVRARVLAGELVTAIASASNVLVMAHRYADFDAFGASVGVARLALYCGTAVNIVSDKGDPNLSGCLALTERLPGYDGMFIDRAGALDLVRADTLLIIVDANNSEIYEAPELADGIAETVVIDHHRKSGEFGRQPLISYIEPSASSASELVAEMLELSAPEGTLEPEEATLLLAGILLDTKRFTKDTGTRTFSAALYLRNSGADPAAADALFKNTLDDFVRLSRFEGALELYRGSIAIAARPDEGDAADRIAAAKAADKLLTVKGVEASFAVVRIGGTVFVSARSTGRINVQLILERFKGGGHFEAAGAQLADTSPSEAVRLIKEAIDQYLG